MSVSSITQTGFNFSFGAASGTFTAYEVLTSNSNHYVASLNQSTRSGSIAGGSAGESFYAAAFTTNTNGKISMSWTAGTNATSYDIYVGGSYIANTSSTSYTHTTGSTGSYSVNIRSRNSSGAETTGVSGSVTINKKYSSGGTAASGNFAAASVIPTISGVTNSSVTQTSATISWSSTNQSSYTISGVGSWSGTTATSRSITGLSAGTFYTATVIVTSSTGNTASGSTSFTTSSAGVAPATPTGVFSCNNGAGTTISWNAVSGATSYEIWYQSSSSQYTGTAADFTGITSTSYNAGASGSFYWFVRARNASGVSSWSTGSLGSGSCPI
jgi:hypothetical protein